MAALAEVQTLDEAAWDAWVAKGVARDHRNNGVRVKVLACAFVLLLLAVAAAWLTKGS